MMEDIKRIATEPTDEDRDWFPPIAGAGDPMEVLKDAWANYRDESFIEQFLSPKLMRDLRMFALHDQSDAGAYRVEAIHNDTGYRRLRSALARQYDVGFSEADIQVTGANLKGDRKLFLVHRRHKGVPLHRGTRDMVSAHIERLWGHAVVLDEEDGEA